MRRFACAVPFLLWATTPTTAQFAPSLPSTGGWRPVEPLAVESPPPGPAIERDLCDVRTRIDRGRDNGDLTRGEARGLRREARRIGRTAQRYGENGLSASERAHLEGLTFALRDQVGRPRPRSAKAPGR